MREVLEVGKIDALFAWLLDLCRYSAVCLLCMCVCRYAGVYVGMTPRSKNKQVAKAEDLLGRVGGGEK